MIGAAAPRSALLARRRVLEGELLRLAGAGRIAGTLWWRASGGGGGTGGDRALPRAPRGGGGDPGGLAGPGRDLRRPRPAAPRLLAPGCPPRPTPPPPAGS